ncbi:DUF86 domain-containing protein [Methylocystis parvus]|uniref:DUF86 domain-containing protein n=1 Tax=Methylocystis parvus TaxID=134 RepID=A0A6B8M7P9_9HYPH|nr:DUF86 domain-containing protein [Methylocystis parvus]QGM97972.1 DUF86 domain-containing protein [Methylocystis parvus]WBK01714.1 DUF86 domain-containing protein [Methylocystis parvus OBBP]
MRERDVFLVLDQMLQASRRATSFIEGMQEQEFLHDLRTQQAVAMSLIVIGEAASRLKRDHEAFLALHPDLPYQHMVGLRNRIAHGYYDLDFRVIWQTVRTDVSALLERLELIYQVAGETLGGAPQGPTQD